MDTRTPRVFIIASSHTELQEEVAVARQAVADAGCEPIIITSFQITAPNELGEVIRAELQRMDAVVVLISHTVATTASTEMLVAKESGLPTLYYVKQSLDTTGAIADLLKSLEAPIHEQFENTTDLRARLHAGLARLRERLAGTSKAPNVEPPRTKANHEAPAATSEQAASTAQPSVSDAHQAGQRPGVPDATRDPGTPRFIGVRNVIHSAWNWTRRRAGALFGLGVIALVSYLWWSKSRIETPTAETTAASAPGQAEQRSIPISYGPVDYGYIFNDELREAPTKSGKGQGPLLSIVRSGTYTIGTDPARLEALVGRVKFENDEQPAHEVEIRRPFAIGMYEILVADYTLFAFATGRPLPLGAAAIVDENSPASTFVDGIPTDGRGAYPVQNVSWFDATAYAEWLSSVTGSRYRLPTEAEWEVAARSQSYGGTEAYWGWTPQMDAGLRCGTINIHWGGDSNYCEGKNGPVPVPGEDVSRIANMIGNVAEWTADCYQPNYIGAPADGSAVSGSNCAERVFRGGWWRSSVQFARPAFRAHAPPHFRDYSIGFRVVRELGYEEIARLDERQRTAKAEPPAKEPPPQNDEGRYPSVVVPDVIGMEEKAAIALMTQAGLDPKPVYKNRRDDSPPPVVVSQSLEAGTRAGTGDIVELLLISPARASQPAPIQQQPADTPAMRRPRVFPTRPEEQNSGDYETNPPQEQQQVPLPRDSPPQQQQQEQEQQQQQQQPPTTTGKDPDASSVGEQTPRQR